MQIKSQSLKIPSRYQLIYMSAIWAIAFIVVLVVASSSFTQSILQRKNLLFLLVLLLSGLKLFKVYKAYRRKRS